MLILCLIWHSSLYQLVRELQPKIARSCQSYHPCSGLARSLKATEVHCPLSLYVSLRVRFSVRITDWWQKFSQIQIIKFYSSISHYRNSYRYVLRASSGKDVKWLNLFLISAECIGHFWLENFHAIMPLHAVSAIELKQYISCEAFLEPAFKHRC